MKLSDLLESPELRDETKDQSNWIDMDEYGNPGRFISIDTMDRKYDIIDQFRVATEPNVLFVVAISKAKQMAGIFFHTKTTENRDVMGVACLVYFKQPVINHPPDDMKGHILQIDRVATVSRYEGSDFATRLYVTLVKLGYIVVSDVVQYKGGMMLWKKLARQTLSGRYLVHIFDREMNDYLRDNNQILSYNGNNLPDDNIWLTDKIGQRFILIART